jgi:ubiquinone/menaquinone biosynthesis C-methylase UbiE
MNQNQIFARSEGDAWFNRNQGLVKSTDLVVNSPDVQYTLQTLLPFGNRIDKVLEIGCSNGVKLEVICNQLIAVGVGIDPSILAVEDGNEREKNTDIELFVGSAEKLPFEDASFDLVSFSFCLYLFDRSTLLRSLTEADRVLKPGGFLVITDFDPSYQVKRPYSHLEGLFSYKQNYAAFFTQTHLYFLLGKQSYSHRVPYFDESIDERLSTNILYKEPDPYPIRD